MALQCLGRHADALGAFASALAQDDKSPQLLNSLTEAAMKSPLRGKYRIMSGFCKGSGLVSGDVRIYSGIPIPGGREGGT